MRFFTYKSKPIFKQETSRETGYNLLLLLSKSFALHIYNLFNTMSALKLVVVAFLACLSAALAFNCDQPDRPNHGGFTPEKKYYRVGKKVNFYCKDGYYVDGVDSTVCVYDRKARRVGWKDPSPVCKRKWIYGRS